MALQWPWGHKSAQSKTAPTGGDAPAAGPGFFSGALSKAHSIVQLPGEYIGGIAGGLTKPLIMPIILLIVLVLALNMLLARAEGAAGKIGTGGA